MKVFNSIEEIKDIEPTVVALGNFDGVHAGHRELIRRAMQTAGDAGIKSAVFTFSNHPRNVMSGTNDVKNIIYQDTKIEILEALGVDYMFSIPFTDDIRTLPPDEFIDKLLLDTFKMREAYCGFNFKFGFKGAGNPEILAHNAITKGFGLHVLQPFTVEGQVVSSTFIRELIEKGDVHRCEKYMSRYYTIEGEVVVGNRLGKSIGFPTSNLNIDDSMVSPPNGVYVTECIYNGVRYPSITNVGVKPTIGKYTKNVETHIFNFDKELYGKNIRVEFLEKMRDEKKFDSVEELSKQITSDCIEAKAYHKRNF